MVSQERNEIGKSGMNKMPIHVSEPAAGFVAVLFAFVSFFPACASDPMTAEILHPGLGVTIDSLKNDRYNIFGRIPGFSAGRLYKTGNRH